MRVIVIGAGKLGYEIARLLSEENHDIVVIDNDPDALAAVDNLDVLTIEGNGASPVVLAALGLPLPDAAVAAISALGNIGPGFANIGPTETFAGFPAGVKLYLMVLMLVGRLEVLGVYALLLPGFWDLRPGRRVRG